MTGALVLAALAAAALPPSPAGPWRATLDFAGGPLRFGITIENLVDGFGGSLCNGSACERFSAVQVRGDSVRFEIADYAATIITAFDGDSLVGSYYNVGNQGPRVIPFHASRGRWDEPPGPARLLGEWDATFTTAAGRSSPRILVFANDSAGFGGTVLSNTGDYGHFAGAVTGDSFAIAHFDGSFVYLLTGRLDGDTLRGVFHAGLRTQTAFTATRSTGRPHLHDPTTLTRADTSTPFRFAFRDTDGRLVTSADARFRGHPVLIDVFGTWCPTCQAAAPEILQLYRDYSPQGLAVVGLAYEVSGDTATDARLVRRYRDKFGIPFPLLLAGTNDVAAAAATLPQLQNFTSFPTYIFLGRDGRVRLVHDGFYGPDTGVMYQHQIASFRAEIERLLAGQ